MNSMKLLILTIALCSFVFSYYDPYYGSNSGTSTYYSTLFDERGLASTTLRLDYANNGNGPVDSVLLDIPGTEVQVVNAYVRGKCPVVGDYYSNSCYNDFALVRVTKEGPNIFRIQFGRSLARAEETNIIVYYRAFGYTKSELTGRSFSFETPKYNFDIDNTRVAVNVDEDLTLKEGESRAEYITGTPSLNSAMSGGLTSASASSSYNSVSYTKGYVRTKGTLLSGETFKVNGIYGKNKILLYLPETAGIIGLILLLVYAIKRMNVLPKPQKNDTVSVESGSTPEKKAVLEKAVGVASVPVTEAKPATKVDALIYALTSATIFAILVSVLLISVVLLKVNLNQGYYWTFLILWFISAVFAYYRAPAGQNWLGAILFVGFCVLIVPLMLAMAAIFASLLAYHPQPYPYYY